MDVANLTRLKARSLDITTSEAIAALFKEHKPATVRTYASAVINLLRVLKKDDTDLFKRWKQALARTHKETDEAYQKSALTDRQKDNWVSWDELVEARAKLGGEVDKLQTGPLRKLTPSQRALMERHLLISMFTLLPPRRNEYGTLEVGEDRKRLMRAGNFYLTGAERDRIVLNDYKTARRHGRQVVPVPDELRKIVRRSLELLPRTHVFAGKDCTGPAGNASIKRMFGCVIPDKNLGSGLVRKIAKTTWEDLRLPQAQRLAAKMGHGLAAAEQYYNASSTRDGEDIPNPMGFAV